MQQKRNLSIHEYQSVQLLNSVRSAHPISHCLSTFYFHMKHGAGAHLSQYGIPTPKAVPAFSAAEAEKVAKDFGTSRPLRRTQAGQRDGRQRARGICADISACRCRWARVEGSGVGWWTRKGTFRQWLPGRCADGRQVSRSSLWILAVQHLGKSGALHNVAPNHSLFLLSPPFSGA